MNGSSSVRHTATGKEDSHEHKLDSWCWFIYILISNGFVCCRLHFARKYGQLIRRGRCQSIAWRAHCTLSIILLLVYCDVRSEKFRNCLHHYCCLGDVELVVIRTPMSVSSVGSGYKLKCFEHFFNCCPCCARLLIIFSIGNREYRTRFVQVANILLRFQACGRYKQLFL